MTTTTLHRTVIEDADFLGVGIAVETCSEHHTEDDREWWHLFHRYETWVGFMPDTRLTGDKVYLTGRVEGINQEIKLELPTLESVKDVSAKYHEIAEVYARHLAPALKAQTFATLAKGMGI